MGISDRRSMQGVVVDRKHDIRKESASVSAAVSGLGACLSDSVRGD